MASARKNLMPFEIGVRQMTLMLIYAKRSAKKISRLSKSSSKIILQGCDTNHASQET